MATIGQYTLPDDLCYDRDSHLWLRRTEAGVTLGLDTLGQAAMGDLAYIAFEPVGKQVQRGEVLGSLEAAKMVSPILAPISGTIVKKNDAVTRQPQLVNTSPYDQGWLMVIEPLRWEQEVRDLVSGAESVQAFLVDQIKQYRDQGWID